MAEETLSYPRPVSTTDRRSDYPLRLLELAFSKSGQTYRLVPTTQVMNKARVATEIAEGKIDVGWMVTSREREQTMRPIRICLFKGLGGWRVALVNRADLSRFSGVRTLPTCRGSGPVSRRTGPTPKSCATAA